MQDLAKAVFSELRSKPKEDYAAATEMDSTATDMHKEARIV